MLRYSLQGLKRASHSRVESIRFAWKQNPFFTARCTLVQSADLRSHVVCLSVCDVGKLWSHKLKFYRNNFTIVSLGCSFSTDPNFRGLLHGEHPEILAQSDPPPIDLNVGDIRSQIATEWLQIAQRSQCRAYRKSPSLFRMVPSLTPTTSPSPKNGVPYAPRYARPYLRNGSFNPLI